MKVHDMGQILIFQSLAKALTNFVEVNDDLKKKIEKIEFKNEIIYILNKYQKNPEILKPDVKIAIKKIVYTSLGMEE